MHRSPLRQLRVPALAVLAAGLLAAPASAATVTSAKLDWSTVKVYDTGAPPDTDRTWLGYVTSAFPLANGSATPSDGATGPTVDRATAAGTAVTWSFPATRGAYEPADGTGTIAFDGAVTFFSPAPGGPPNGGHGFTISVTDPRIVLNGDSGQLFASGTASSGSPYTDGQAVWNLDLSGADVRLHADGSRTISGIVPSVATDLLVFPAPYLAGTGPNRTPNIFGAFSIRVKTAPVAGPKGDKGDKGDAGAPGKAVVLQTSLLRRALFKDGGKRHAISLLSTKSKAVVARGAVRARTIRVRLAEGRTKRLSGVYLLKVDDQAAVRVRVL